MISKYYLIPNDKHWKGMIKQDINRKSVESLATYDANFHFSSSYVLVGNNNSDTNTKLQIKSMMEIFVFICLVENGPICICSTQLYSIKRLNIDMKSQSYKIKQLHDIQCPKQVATCHYCHAVFCQKSQTIHLYHQTFGTSFNST